MRLDKAMDGENVHALLCTGADGGDVDRLDDFGHAVLEADNSQSAANTRIDAENPHEGQAKFVQECYRSFECALDAKEVALLDRRRIVVVEVVQFECVEYPVEAVNKIA